MLKSLFNWKVLLNIVLACAIFAGLVWLTFRWLEVKTNHGKEIPVPNITNMTVHEAIKVLDDVGLTYEVDSFKFDPKYKPYQVLQIYPSAGSRVKDGRTIIIKVNPSTWAKVAVPDVLDRFKNLAFERLELVGLKVGDTIYEPNIQKDAVIRMIHNGSTIKPGTLLPKFSVIDLVIGSGPRRNVPVPNLIGLSVKQAKAVIKQNYFEVGLIDYDGGQVDENSIVYYQDPVGGDIRDQGMQIDIWASRKTPAEMHLKIKELDAVYRGYTTTPQSTNNTSINSEPLPETGEKPKATTTTAPKPKTTPDTETPKPATNTTPKEQPKPKKVIVE